MKGFTYSAKKPSFTVSNDAWTVNAWRIFTPFLEQAKGGKPGKHLQRKLASIGGRAIRVKTRIARLQCGAVQ